MYLKLLITLLLIVFINSGYAQTDADFKYVTSSTDSSKFFVFIEKVSDDGTKDIWLKIKNPLEDERGKKIKNGGGTTLMLIRMDCSNREYDNLETIVYNKSGKITADSKNVSFDNRIVPGSVMTGIYDFVCRN